VLTSKRRVNLLAVNPSFSKRVALDKDDNNILYLAQYIDADLIITGDKDLLELKIIKKSMIINPRTFMEKYHNMH